MSFLSLPLSVISAAVGLISNELMVSLGPVVMVTLLALLLTREVLSIKGIRKMTLRYLDVFIVPLFILFSYQIVLVLLGV